VGIRSAGTRLRLKAPRKRQDYVDDFLRRNRIELGARLVGMCIGAYWPTKRWPPVYFASLGESLRERGYQPVLLGGPAERDLTAQIMESVRVPLLSCVGNTLRESAALLQACEMTVGGDSGLTHMARALGVPTVLIYGPTDHRAHTFGDRTRVLTAKVKCRPCSPHGPRRCPERHHDCMRLVSPESVLEALGEIANLQTPVPSRPEGAERSQATGPALSP
jgi:ADP-heptose:LPS heptosyltransferase